jgi:hypothetical protein
MISINNLTFSSSKAPIGTVVGTLSLFNQNVAAMGANFMLNQGCAAFFAISGSNIVTTNVIPPGVYSVHVFAVGTKTRWREKAYFPVSVTP